MQNLSSAEYLELVNELPLPTDEQIARFVDYVSHAHSWYKGRIDPRGGRFYFYLDKYAGCDTIRDDRGLTLPQSRRKTGFHYSSIPTREYRASFGYLAYTRFRHKTIFDRDMRLAYIPTKTIEIGEARISGVIHTLSFQTVLLDHEYYANRMDHIDWPEQSGGKEAFKEIIAVASAIGSRWRRPGSSDQPAHREKVARLIDSDSRPYAAEYVDVLLYAKPEVLTLYELLASERERQYEEMARSIRRICAYIDDHRFRA